MCKEFRNSAALLAKIFKFSKFLTLRKSSEDWWLLSKISLYLLFSYHTLDRRCQNILKVRVPHTRYTWPGLSVESTGTIGIPEEHSSNTDGSSHSPDLRSDVSAKSTGTIGIPEVHSGIADGSSRWPGHVQ